MAKDIGKLLGKIGDKDPSVRKSVIKELADGDERAIFPLIKALSDESAGVQDAAMRSLISIGGEVTAYMVLPLLRENVYLRSTAATILTQLGSIAVPLLYPLLKDKDDGIRKFAIDLLAGIAHDVDAASIVPLLKDSNSNVRAAAAWAIGQLGYRQAVPELVDALHDEEWVCFSALEALGELKEDSAVEQIAALLKLPSEVVRLEAIDVLGKIGSGRAADRLAGYLQQAAQYEKNSVIKSLIRIGVTPDLPDIAERMITMLKEGEWEDKNVALKGIAALNCKEAVHDLVDIAGSLDPLLPDNEEKICTLKSTIKALDSEDELLRLLELPDIKYRGKSLAIEILGEMRNGKAVPLLIRYLNDSRRDLRRASALALTAVGGPESVKPLLDTSRRDDDAHVRRQAAEALGNIRMGEAYEPLLQLLHIETYYDVLEKIVEALIKIDARSFLSGAAGYSDVIRGIIAKTAQL